MFWNGKTATDGLSGSGKPARVGAGAAIVARHSVNPDRTGDIFQAVLADVVEGQVELAGGVLLHSRRNTDAARLRQGFEPGSDVDPVAKDVTLLHDDVALMDTNAEFNPFRGGGPGIAPGHRLLHLGRAAQSVHHAGEFDEQSVAGGLDQPAAMCGDLGVDQFAAVRLQPCQRAFLVGAHQPAVAGNIRRQDGR